MNILKMTDEKIYELGIKVLTKILLVLLEPRGFSISANPRRLMPAVVWQTLSHLKMEKIQKEIFQAYEAKHPVPENEHIQNLSTLPDMTLYELGLDAILDELGPRRNGTLYQNTQTKHYRLYC